MNWERGLQEHEQARRELEAARTKAGSLQMEVDLYRQECESAWAKVTQQQQELKTKGPTEEEAEAMVAAARPGAAEREAWVTGEIQRLRAENGALAGRLEQVTKAVLAGGGADALRAALRPATTGGRRRGSRGERGAAGAGEGGGGRSSGRRTPESAYTAEGAHLSRPAPSHAYTLPMHIGRCGRRHGPCRSGQSAMIIRRMVGHTR
eukprot:COSAG01_NODE_36_length_34092_cov_26.350032_3_plen_207_part_00